MIGMGFVMTIRKGRVFISDRSYHRFLIELKHSADRSWRDSWLSRAKPEPVNKPDERGLIEKHTDKSWRQGLI